MTEREHPVPLRPLFSWGEHEALLAELVKANSHLATVNQRLRVATHGKTLLNKKKRDAVHRVLKLELKILKLEKQHAQKCER